MDTLDQDAVNLAKAIKMQESGNDPSVIDGSKKGKAGEQYGYQWMPGMYDAESKQYFGSVLPPTNENQNKVAYAKIKALKDEGKSPGEIAAIWNGAHKDANGVYQANNPEYVDSVKKFYDQFKGTPGQVLGASQNSDSIAPPIAPPGVTPLQGGNMLAPPTAPAPFTPEAETAPVTNPFKSPGENIIEGNSKTNSDRSIGAAKGLLSNLQSADSLYAANKLAGNDVDFTGRNQAQRTAITAPSNVNQQAGSTESDLLAGMLPVSEGKAAVGATKKAIGAALTGPKDAVLQAVMPRLVSTVAADTKTTTQGLLKKIVPVATKRLKQVAEAARPYYDAGATWSKNAENVANAITDQAQQLKNTLTQKNIPYIFKELKSDLKNIEIPHFIKTSDTLVQKRAQSIVDKFMEIAKSKDGTLQSLLDARKEFDSWIQNEYPRVFDESGNAVNQLVGNVRKAANDFIAERAPDIAVKDSLKNQNLLYDALDTFKEKSALGDKQTVGEIGTTGLGRWASAHPGLMGAGKWLGSAATTGLIGGGIVANQISAHENNQ